MTEPILQGSFFDLQHINLWDRDGDQDLVIGGEAGTLYFFRRDWLEKREHGYEIG